MEEPTVVIEPLTETVRSQRAQTQQRPKQQPRYHVILWNDDDHSYPYVVRMLQELFAHPPERGFQLAKEVDRSGRAILLTTTREHAELKQEQVHAFGRDELVAVCCGSMSATIEPEPE
ncbi:MAG: ATP-dependent Clp protease adaptor ClpS [Planctomycetia bacterium]|nr:ATP-dependent Clp protease adaptor ClpS [Planctomycetia bacterium]